MVYHKEKIKFIVSQGKRCVGAGSGKVPCTELSLVSSLYWDFITQTRSMALMVELSLHSLERSS
jgi:hypothetical protein